METITLGQIAGAVALLAGLITGGGVIIRQVRKALDDALSEKFNGVNQRLDELANDIKEVNKFAIKSYLMQELRAIEEGAHLGEMEMSYFKDQYHYYRDVLHENSYIREKYESLKERGLL